EQRPGGLSGFGPPGSPPGRHRADRLGARSVRDAEKRCGGPWPRLLLVHVPLSRDALQVATIPTAPGIFFCVPGAALPPIGHEHPGMRERAPTLCASTPA